MPCDDTPAACVTLLEAVQKLVILLNDADRLHRGAIQDPAQHKDPDGQPDLPCPCYPGMPPDQGQSKGPHGQDRDDDEGLAKIPRDLFFCRRSRSRGIQELAAVLAFDRGILDLFGAERALFHDLLSLENARATRLILRVALGPQVELLVAFFVLLQSGLDELSEFSVLPAFFNVGQLIVF